MRSWSEEGRERQSMAQQIAVIFWFLGTHLTRMKLGATKQKALCGQEFPSALENQLKCIVLQFSPSSCFPTSLSIAMEKRTAGVNFPWEIPFAWRALFMLNKFSISTVQLGQGGKQKGKKAKGKAEFAFAQSSLQQWCAELWKICWCLKEEWAHEHTWI